LDCDRNLLEAGKLHQVLFIVDGGPKVISVMVDGELCDGGVRTRVRLGRFHPNLMSPNGASTAALAPSLHGSIDRVRLYDRCLLSNEALGNWRASWRV
jgi:hypothetical protein